MPLYEYKGVSTGGKPAKGVVEADSSKTARLKLKSKGIFTTEIRERSTQQQKETRPTIGRGGGVKLKNMTLMIRQLSTLIRAHIPLDEALSSIVDQTEETKLKSVMSQVRESVNEGRSLADSCKMFPRVFNPIFISMIRVGEASGNLDLVLNRLAQFSENQFELRNKILGAIAYPAFMAVAGIGVTIFLFSFALPKITDVFAGSKMALPTLTVVMLAISSFMSQHWLAIVCSLIGSVFLFQWYVSTSAGKAWWDRFSLRVPVFGNFKRMVAVSRFARTLATLVGSGVQLLDAIDIVKDVVDNSVLKKALIESRESISEGHTIAGPLRASGEFPPILTHMIAVGEKTGELEEVLNVVADSYDGQVDTAIKSMTRLLEPLMIVLLGGLIGVIALSILLPMLQLNTLSTLPG